MCVRSRQERALGVPGVAEGDAVNERLTALTHRRTESQRRIDSPVHTHTHDSSVLMMMMTARQIEKETPKQQQQQARAEAETNRGEGVRGEQVGCPERAKGQGRS